MEADIDSMEAEIFSAQGNVEVEQIYLLKREIVELRRAVRPLAVALQRLASDNQDLLWVEVMRYFRDLIEKQNQAADRIISYDELLCSLVQAALARVATQQNTECARSRRAWRSPRCPQWWPESMA